MINDSPHFYWSLFRFEHWNMYLVASETGLCRVDTLTNERETPEEEAEEAIRKWIFRHFSNRQLSDGQLIRSEEHLQPYMAQYEDYFAGKRTQFTFSLDLHGTPFQISVWKALLTIPYGLTASYSDVAGKIGKRQAVRAVGRAIGANPVLIAVPCHRVIGKDGTLTGFRAGLTMKQKLLEIEAADYTCITAARWGNIKVGSMPS